MVAESSEAEVRENAGGRAVEHAQGHVAGHSQEHALEQPQGHVVEHAQGHAVEHSAEHAPVRPYDPMAEPSAEWGWHGTFPRLARLGGWAIAAILLFMLIGNHRGRVEDVWLVGLAAIVVIVLVRDQMRRRTSWRR